MKTSHKRVAEWVGEVVEGTDMLCKAYPHKLREDNEQIAIVLMYEKRRLGELAYKGYLENQ